MDEQDASSGVTDAERSGWLHRSAAEARRVDVAVYSAIADTSTPSLDDALRQLGCAADYSRLSIASAAILGIIGGRRGRDAAKMGLASVAVTATVVNLGVKSIVHRRRPDRGGLEVPLPRHVRMPSSTSFPSGHA